MSDPNTEARETFDAIILRAEEGDPQTDWLPTIARLAREGLAALERAERALERDSAADRYWRSIVADTIIGLRATNASPAQIAGALERTQIAARDLEALAFSSGAAPDLLTRDEKISLRTAVSCLAEDYPHAAGLPHAESALRKLRATQADTDEP